MGRRLLQSERNAYLLIDVLRSLVAAHKFQLHDFVIMPDHLHVLLTVEDGMSIEKAIQLIKGRFSHHLTKEYGHLGEVWQRGFADSQVMNRQSYLQHRAYIANNPVKAGLVDSPEQYPFCFESLARQKASRNKGAGAEAQNTPTTAIGTTEVVPFHKTIRPEVDSKRAVGGSTLANEILEAGSKMQR